DGELDRVKLCGNDACAWLFIDVSRNRSRRWCDMKDCGNRAKARRHYARQKEVPASDRS
ncbi:MAG: CGNR zinc finger domain-containing protein, partial [Longimicrobiales bacterium]